MLEEIKISYKPNYNTDELPAITCSADAQKILQPLYDEDTISYLESFLVLFLNRQNKVFGWKTVSVGGTSACVVDAKVVFQMSLLMNASGIIISHNHPSGSVTPSPADRQLTNKLVQIGKLMELPVLDHIITTPGGQYYSFADQGEI